MRQRLSRPFGRPSPPYTEREAMGDLVKLIRENVDKKYEVGYAVRARDCSGRTRVEMLDGNGGSALSFANACDDSIVVGSGGVAEIWWAQRSNGRTVRLLFDRGTRAGRSTIERKVFPVSRQMPAAPATVYEWVVVGSGNDPILFSGDSGATWTSVGGGIFTTGYCVHYADGMWVAGGDGANTLAYSTDGSQWYGAGTTTFGASGKVKAITHDGTQWIAVAETTTSHSPYATSANGVNWTEGAVNSAYYGGGSPLAQNFFPSAVSVWSTNFAAFGAGRMLYADEQAPHGASISTVNAFVYDGIFGGVIGGEYASGGTIQLFPTIGQYSPDNAPYVSGAASPVDALGDGSNVYALLIDGTTLYAAGGNTSGTPVPLAHTTDGVTWTPVPSALAASARAYGLSIAGGRTFLCGRWDTSTDGWSGGYSDDLSTWTAVDYGVNYDSGNIAYGVAGRVAP